MAIRPDQRHGRRLACAVCGGGSHLPQHRGVRCVGYTVPPWCCCSREERSGGLPAKLGPVGALYVHRLDGPCLCGIAHGGAPVAGPVKAPALGDEHPLAKGCLFRSPVPDGAPPPPWARPGARQPVAVYTWHDAKGRPCFFTIRWEWTRDGERVKAVTPRTVWERSDGALVWEKVGPPSDWQRPLFNLPSLTTGLALPVLVVEGEKAAIAAAARLSGFVVVTWHGGSSSAHLTDWRPLAGREVVIWPDADDAGHKAATAIAAECRAIGATSVRIVNLPPGLPPGWDLADEWPEGLEVPAWTA